MKKKIGIRKILLILCIVWLFIGITDFAMVTTCHRPLFCINLTPDEHYEKYEGVIDKISSWFNNLFLKANGVPGGIKNYSETTSSLVALYEQLKNS